MLKCACLMFSVRDCCYWYCPAWCMFVLELIRAWPFTTHPFYAWYWVVHVCLFACATLDTSSDGEEGYAGDLFVGEDQGQPEPTGKPPLALAYFNPIFLCICFGYENAFLFLWRGCLWHSDTTPNITTPVGAAIRIVPIIPELVERVLNTLLSLWKPLWRIRRSTMVGDAGREKNV